MSLSNRTFPGNRACCSKRNTTRLTRSHCNVLPGTGTETLHVLTRKSSSPSLYKEKQCVIYKIGSTVAPRLTQIKEDVCDLRRVQRAIVKTAIRVELYSKLVRNGGILYLPFCNISRLTSRKGYRSTERLADQLNAIILVAYYFAFDRHTMIRCSDL